MHHSSSKVLAALSCFFAIGNLALGQASEAPGATRRGTFLLESDLVSFSKEYHTPERDGHEYLYANFGDMLLSTGIANGLDIQFGYTGWQHVRDAYEGVDEHSSSDGQVCVRLKYDLMDQETRGWGLSLLPYYYTAFGEAHRRQFGVVLPWLVPLGDGWDLGGQLGVERIEGEEHVWETSTLGSLYLYRTVSEQWGGYVEAYGNLPYKTPRTEEVQVGLGLVWSPTATFSTDVGLYAGLQRKAPDWSAVLRLSLLR